MLTPKPFEKWNNQSLKLLPSSFYFNVRVKGTPKKLSIVIQACNLSIWEDKEEGAWVWGLPGLHSDTMSQNNNNYKASKAFMAKDALGTAHRCSPWRHTGTTPPAVCEHQDSEVSPVPDTGTGKANTAWLLQSHSCFTWHVRHQQRHVSLLTDTSSLPCKVDLQALCGFLIEQRDFPPKLLSRWILLTERWNIITELGLYQPTTPTWILSKLSPWIFLRLGTLPVASWGVLECRSHPKYPLLTVLTHSVVHIVLVLGFRQNTFSFLKTRICTLASVIQLETPGKKKTVFKRCPDGIWIGCRCLA